MKTINASVLTTAVLLSLFLQGALVAQTPTLKFSDVPTTSEIEEAFRDVERGKVDPFEVVKEIGKKGNPAIPALQEVILATATDASQRDTVRNNALYSALALDIIGTPESYNALLQTATSHNDPEVRARALASLAGSYYFRMMNGKSNLVPDARIVHTLWTHLDDSSTANNTILDMRGIAREGIKNWLGADLGNRLTGTTIKGAAKQAGITETQYRENLWLQFSSKLSWNKQSAHFEEHK